MNKSLDITFNGSYISKLRVVVSLLKICFLLVFNEKAILSLEDFNPK